MIRTLSNRVAALEQSRRGDFVEVLPLAYFYGEAVAPTFVPMKEFDLTRRGLDAFYIDAEPEA